MQGKLDLVNLDAIARALHLGEVTLVTVVHARQCGLLHIGSTHN